MNQFRTIAIACLLALSSGVSGAHDGVIRIPSDILNREPKVKRAGARCDAFEDQPKTWNAWHMSPDGRIKYRTRYDGCNRDAEMPRMHVRCMEIFNDSNEERRLYWVIWDSGTPKEDRDERSRTFAPREKHESCLFFMTTPRGAVFYSEAGPHK